MSDYVRKKCVRFKIPQNIIDKLKNEDEWADEWLEDLLLKEYNVKENYHTKNVIFFLFLIFYHCFMNICIYCTCNYYYNCISRRHKCISNPHLFN